MQLNIKEIIMKKSEEYFLRILKPDQDAKLLQIKTYDLSPFLFTVKKDLNKPRIGYEIILKIIPYNSNDQRA